MALPGFNQLVNISRAASATRDDEGRITPTLAPVASDVEAAVAMADFRAIDYGTQLGIEFNTVVLVRLGTDVQLGDVIDVTGDVPLAGSYEVRLIRHTYHHLRVFCIRAGTH